MTQSKNHSDLSTFRITFIGMMAAIIFVVNYLRIPFMGTSLHLTNGLCAALHMERSEALSLMEKAGLDPRVRGETLTLEELSCLADAYTAARKEAMECRKPE